MSYVQPGQTTASGCIDSALQNYLSQLQNCTTNSSQAPPSNIDFSTLSGLHNSTDAAMFQSDIAALEPLAAQSTSTAYGQHILPNVMEQAMQLQQGSSMQTADNSKQSAVWVQRNRKNQKQYRQRQKARQANEYSLVARRRHVCKGHASVLHLTGRKTDLALYSRRVLMSPGDCRRKSRRWKDKLKRWQLRLKSSRWKIHALQVVTAPWKLCCLLEEMK